jgi:hypothetical protein
MTAPTVRVVSRAAFTEEWERRNPILMNGEPGLDKDLRRVKWGDGHTRWNDLPYSEYIGGGGSVPGVRYSHHQTSPAASWNVPHGLGMFREPVVILDSDPTKPVLTDVTLVDANTAVIVFPTPVTGWAHF